ncbi:MULTISPECIES: flagellar hook protein FlgE [unclassified Marinobacter]|uniref:flagellar hook protein FlgE n=1 Tax=unclassified Marinobacter TaxID=83889 RepID=UPI0026E44C12|nr:MULTISPECIES: flagellar hook protein FlgE [unclassified Marinobacter]MDO6442115.1 flagellar hook protein FlgE [Marinobacter sp. 2_MG-2023]MDO6825119.1 flagellar hook protein FlgE [Marinobacter sp. 1_MG-2023]
MAFNTGLSGLRAAAVDLDVTGNNIANASTVGFKGSRVQFGDLYASGFLSGGSAPVGDGVNVQDVKQSFSQGNISFTDSGLDMAISGDGFFILNNGGETRYSRAGQFTIDKDGFVVNAQSMRVQGYTADDDGNLSGIRGDLEIATDNLAPRRTTSLTTDLNLDSRESVLESRVRDVGPLAFNDISGEQFEITYSDGTPNYSVDLSPATTAGDIADIITNAPGLSASATTTASIVDTNVPAAPPLTDSYISAAQTAGSFSFSLSVNNAPLQLDTSTATTLLGLRDAINRSSDTAISASVVDDGTGNDVLRVIHNQGEDLEFSYGNGTPADSVSTPITVSGDVNVTGDRSIVGLSGLGADTDFADAYTNSPIRITNEFNPLDQRTYNHATSTSIFDSLGNSHEMTQFFVKEPSPGNGVGVSQWSVYLQIDGEMVAGTDTTPYTARFDQDGTLQSVDGDANGEILITDWIPKDSDGQPNGADGPPPAGTNVVTPIPEPPTSSAFVLSLGGTTQYGAAFGVDDQRQNGYTTGRLSGLDVSGEGTLFARYTNGQSKALGQVALASFNNTNGLSPIGDTSWVETFESGQPIIGQPDTGTLGSIAASSVEESNVDLSAELVNLIIAQRNYQANAKTIETSDAVTQTIINLR